MSEKMPLSGQSVKVTSDNTPPLISDLAIWRERESMQPKRTPEGYRSEIFNLFYETFHTF